MNKEEAKARIAKLKKTIQYHRYLYHVLDKQEISDEALDSLKKELFDLEQKFPDLITPDSPTQRVGGKPLKKFKKVRHEKRMLSFNDAFSRKDMEDWLRRLENYLGHKIVKSKDTFYCELKIDGLAIELVYEDGILKQGSTRGDGEIGEDVTANLKTIEAIPLRLYGNAPKKLIVRGEVFIDKKEFQRINQEQKKRGGKLYANPRNIAAGSVRQLDPKITAQRNLDSFAYDIVTDLGKKTHEEEHEELKKLGFKTNPHNKSAASLEEVFEFHDYWAKHRGLLPYEIDGIVVIVNDNKVFERAGVVGKAPRAAIAFKFSPKEATTRVKDIKVQVGRTGILTPVAVLEPVEVGGVTITHATLHNYDQIKKLGIKIGDTVIVSRAGDVIPQVTKVLKRLRSGKEKSFHMPAKCPIDGSKVIKEGAFYKCSNKRGAAIHRRALHHFVSKPAFDIEGLGPKIIDKFMDNGLISDAADIFELEKGDIAALEGFGEKSADNIIKEIESKRKISLPRFLYALGILHVGEETSLLLAQELVNEKSISRPKEILEVFEKIDEEKLKAIPDIGPAVAKSIKDYFNDAYSRKLIKKLDEVGVKIDSSGLKPRSKRLAGKTFVVTGTLASMTRDEAKAKIRQKGGNVSSSVSKNTDYLVVGKDPGSNKYEAAQKLGVKMINEEEFLKMLK